MAEQEHAPPERPDGIDAPVQTSGTSASDHARPAIGPAEHTRIRVLVVEDSEDAVLLMEEELRSGGFDPTVARVETAETMCSALDQSAYDIILMDYRLPHFSGPAALGLVRERGLDIPVIIVSGTVGEERAVELMRSGARDLILKENLSRLVPAVERELREAEVRGQRRRMEAELEEARQRMLETEVEKKTFYREIVRAVTHGKFILADAADIPFPGDCRLDVPLDGPQVVSALRKCAEDAALAAGMSRERATDLVLAVGEAVTNAIKHAAHGRCAICTSSERVLARISDGGGGIRTEDLPAMVSRTGFSTQASLGMGYTIMLELMDRVWLATGPEGTVVQLEMCVQPVEDESVVLPATWDRL